MGTIMAVVATFDIHIEIKLVVAINPARRNEGLLPTFVRTYNAIRL